MTRRCSAFLLAILLSAPALVEAAAQEPEAIRKSDFVPLTDWDPQPGDKAFVREEDGTYAVANFFAAGNMAKAMVAEDQGGIRELVRAKKVASIPDLSPGLVIKKHENPFAFEGVPILEVRLLSGATRTSRPGCSIRASAC